MVFRLEANEMSYSHRLSAKVFKYPLTHAVRKNARRFQVATIVSFAAPVVPELTNASPEEFAKDKKCFSCHKVDGRRIGPAYIDIAKKYAQDKDAEAKLIRKIKEGSINPSDKIDLPPQPIVAMLSHFAMDDHWHKTTMPPQTQVNAEEARQLADWILSLGK